MDKAERIKQKRLKRHKARRKNKISSDNPVRQRRKERIKQLLKARKIRKGKLQKEKKK
jgi:hypothetical protein